MIISRIDKIKYIDNNVSLGIDYDRKKINATLERLIDEVCKTNGIDTRTFYHDDKKPDIMWEVLASERNVGKTTYEILKGFVMHLMYGTRMEYVRHFKESVAPSNAKSLFATILDMGYIEALTNGMYNHIYYKDKYWSFSHINDSGEVDMIAPEPFMRMHNLQDSVEVLKSTYNSPRGDIIIFDEFIPLSGLTTESQWLGFCQLVETIRRSRLSIRIKLLANTINSMTHFFHELGIFDHIQKMKIGEKKIVPNIHGTDVYIHLIKFEGEIAEKRKVNNLKVFGFLYRNPKLASITGVGSWEVKNYPHLSQAPKDDYEVISPIIYFIHYGRNMRLEIRESKTLGPYAFVWETHTDPLYMGNELIYTLQQPSNPQEVYALGIGKPIDKLIMMLYKQNRFYYSFNDIGNLFENYVIEAAKASRL